MAANRAFLPFGPQVKRGTVANAGLFGTPGSLPTGGGPVDPPILTGGGSNYVGPLPAGDLRTRLDPNMGYIPPSVQVSGGGPNSSRFAGSGISFSPSGQLRGGVNGPQGSVYGVDPNTGQNIYNVTGSPAPGFFDSTLGKITEGVGSAGLNMFVPGLGFVSKAIFDAYRRNQAKSHTGTDLSGNNNTASQPSAAQAPTGPAWFQPGYQPPAGIRAAIGRGDYDTAYGMSPGSARANWEMQNQAYGGTPNDPGTTSDEGQNRFYNGVFQRDAEGGYSQVAQSNPGLRPTMQLRNSPEGIAAYNAWAMRQKPMPLPPSWTNPVPIG